MNWTIQVNWNGHWVTVDQGYKSQDDAEWATGKWKQANRCFGDPFRAVQVSGPQLITLSDPDIEYANRLLAQEAEEHGGEG